MKETLYVALTLAAGVLIVYVAWIIAQLAPYAGVRASIGG